MTKTETTYTARTVLPLEDAGARCTILRYALSPNGPWSKAELRIRCSLAPADTELTINDLMQIVKALHGLGIDFSEALK